MLQDSLGIPYACAFPRGSVSFKSAQGEGSGQRGASQVASESFEVDREPITNDSMDGCVNRIYGTMLANFIISSRDHEYIAPCTTTNTKPNENARIHNCHMDSLSLNLRDDCE
jgi:hypothetical protein